MIILVIGKLSLTFAIHYFQNLEMEKKYICGLKKFWKCCKTTTKEVVRAVARQIILKKASRIECNPLPPPAQESQIENKRGLPSELIRIPYQHRASMIPYPLNTLLYQFSYEIVRRVIISQIQKLRF